MAYANNQSTSKQSNEGREFYDNTIEELSPMLYGDDKLLDIWSSASQKYGRINLFNQVVYPNETKMTHHDDALVFDFVSECLDDMKDYITSSIALETLDPEVGSLFPLRIQNGYVDIHTRHTLYMQGMINDFLKNVTETGDIKNILTYKDFETRIIEHARAHSSGMLFSKNHYYSSKQGSPMMSGLFVEVNLFSHDDDREKLKIVTDNNFPYFVETARRHGFFIDKNAPWRMVVDVRSCYVRNKLKKKGVSNLNEFFEAYFTPSHTTEVLDNCVFLKEMWNAFSAAEPFVDRLINTDAGLATRTHKREPMANLEDRSRRSWARSYIRIRTEEVMGNYSVDYVLDLLHESEQFLEQEDWAQKLGDHIENQLMRKKYKKSLTKASDIYKIIEQDCPDVVEEEPLPKEVCEITDDDVKLPDSEYEEPTLPDHVEATIERVTEGRVYHSVHSTDITAEGANQARIEELGTMTPVGYDP